MAKSKRNAGFEPDIPDGLQIERRIDYTCYIGNRADILKAGILPAELLPKKFQDFSVIHNGRHISGSKWGWGKWTRWEMTVDLTHDEILAEIEESRARRLQDRIARRPTLTLIQGGKAARE